MVRYLLTLPFLLCLLSNPLTANEDPALREILNKHVDAMGGWQNWNKVESIRLAGTIEREGKLVDFVIIKKRPNQIRATITMPIPGNEEEKVQIIRAHDGKNAWTATRLTGSQKLKKEKLDQTAAKELLADAGVLPKLISFWQQGADLELKQTKDLYLITASNENGTQYSFEINPITYRTNRIKTINAAQIESTMEFAAYTESKGVYLPKISLIQGQATGDSQMTVTSVKVGVGIYEEYFSSENGQYEAVVSSNTL